MYGMMCPYRHFSTSGKVLCKPGRSFWIFPHELTAPVSVAPLLHLYRVKRHTGYISGRRRIHFSGALIHSGEFPSLDYG